MKEQKYQRFYEARFHHNKFYVSWYEQTGRYGEPSEWEGGDFEVIRGYVESGTDIQTSVNWFSWKEDDGHGSDSSSWKTSPKADIKFQIDKVLRYIELESSVLKEKSVLLTQMINQYGT